VDAEDLLEEIGEMLYTLACRGGRVNLCLGMFGSLGLWKWLHTFTAPWYLIVAAFSYAPLTFDGIIAGFTYFGKGYFHNKC